MTESILANLTELNAAYQSMPPGWRLAAFLLSAVILTIFFYGFFVAYGVVMARVLRTLREERVSPDPFHNTYCRSCEAWKYTDATACQHVGDDGRVCNTPLQIYPDDPIGFAKAMAEVYPLPTPRSFADPVAKGFDRSRAMVFDGHRETPHAKLIQMHSRRLH